VWDVDRLIRLAHELPIKTVPLASSFEFEEVDWFDEQYRPTCRAVVSHVQRIQEADPSLPIILSADGHVMDGMHRVAKAWLLGRTEIHVVNSRGAVSAGPGTGSDCGNHPWELKWLRTYHR
jgi:hypothetical protein